MAQPKLTDDYIRGRGQDVFSNAKHGGQLIEDWSEELDLYNSVYQPKEKDKSDVLIGQSKLFIPKIYSHIQRMLVDVIDTFFFDPEEIVSISSSHKTSKEEKDIVKSLLNYRLSSHPINFYEEVYEAALDALVNKSAAFKVYPKITTEKSTDLVLDDDGNPILDEEGLPQEKTVDIIKDYAPQLECMPLEDVYFSTEATWKNYYKHPIVCKYKRSLDYLKRRGYKNLERFEEQAVGSGDAETDIIKQQREPEKQSPFSTNAENVNSNEIYVFEFWDFLDVNRDGLLESCSYIMAGSDSSPDTIIRGVEENTLPYKYEGEDYVRPPIVFGQAFPEAHKLRGKSIPELTKDLQREANSITNQRREAVALELRKPLLVNRGANINLQSLVNRKISGVVLGDDISGAAVRELDIKTDTGSSVQELARNDKDFQEITSIVPNLLGMQQSADETATAVTSQGVNANKKIGLLIKNLTWTLVLPALDLLLRLEQAYETDEFIQKVTEESLPWGNPENLERNGVTVGRETIQGDFGLKVNTAINKQQQLNKIFLLTERFNLTNQTTMQLAQAGVLPQDQVHIMDTMKLLHDGMKILGFKDTEEYIIRPEAAETPPEGAGGEGAPGIASQPGLSAGAPEASVSNLNPEGMEGPGEI